jgi:nucleoside-diphosphate-sugar epimerase
MITIVITGARGYIGTALAKRLADTGYALRLVSRTSDAPRIAAGRTVGIEYVQADLREEGAWSELMADAHTIVHLSSRTDLRAAEADPSGDDNINIKPVRSLIRAAARSGARPRVIFASTVTIVGDQHDNPVDEQTPDRSCSVYDRHKLVCETLLRAATVRGQLRACSLRLSNVYGYGQASINANRGILNVMLTRATKGEALTLFGDGQYVRDFIHLDDVAEAFSAAVAIDRICDGRHYVIASGRGRAFAEVFDLVAREALLQTDRRIEIRCVPEPGDLHPIERRNFVGNSSLFHSLTGWQPRIDLEAGIHDYFVRAAASPALAAGR